MGVTATTRETGLTIYYILYTVDYKKRETTTSGKQELPPKQQLAKKHKPHSHVMSGRLLPLDKCKSTMP